ncbi:BMP family lipoprotein [Eremococcus coleocola]|uniref:BMP family lipoprotein n=1 Tax=Eremococcus coleocola TaxID=88132 RepID=UPI00040BD6DF
MSKFFKAASVALTLGSVLAPAAMVVAQESDDFSAVIVTDVGGVDDKSFNQSAWEGLQAWGEEAGKEKGAKGYDYIQSDSDSDYITNLNTAVQSGFDLTFGIGFKLEEAINQIAQQNPDSHFAIVDSFVDQPNVASYNFKDHEASFLAGVAAAMTTKTNKVGFVGGVEGVIIDRFEAGFVAGVKAVNPDIEVSVEYAGSFADAPKGKQIAAAMFKNGADVIFHASGDTGNGVFSEAKDLVKNDPSQEIWVIGVDRDQDAEGVVEIDGEERHLTLTSTLKGVGEAVKLATEQAAKGEFKAGNNVLGLKEDGVGLADGQLSDEIKEKVAEYKDQIINGDIEVPEKPE